MNYMIPAAVAVSVVAIATPSLTLAYNQVGPDAASIAADLGVPEAVFQTCLHGPGLPARDEALPRPNHAAVAICLQDEGSSLTSNQIMFLLERNHPERGPHNG